MIFVSIVAQNVQAADCPFFFPSVFFFSPSPSFGSLLLFRALRSASRPPFAHSGAKMKKFFFPFYIFTFCRSKPPAVRSPRKRADKLRILCRFFLHFVIIAVAAAAAAHENLCCCCFISRHESKLENNENAATTIAVLLLLLFRLSFCWLARWSSERRRRV